MALGMSPVSAVMLKIVAISLWMVMGAYLTQLVGDQDLQLYHPQVVWLLTGFLLTVV